jgi:class 3 adenylate cyclase/tetratricopeptide (TPR) repeat protein
MGRDGGRRREGERIAVAAESVALASFLPGRLVRRLAEEPESAGLPHADRLAGALLLADISGFTATAERLASRGPGGAEELRGLLDGAFGPLLELIAGTGGDVLKFAGDALLACWPAEGSGEPHNGPAGGRSGSSPADGARGAPVDPEGSGEPQGGAPVDPEGSDPGAALAAATATAAGCAEAMQTALDRFARAKRLRLALRIGIGAGEVVVLDVGGERERRELLVAGAAVPQTTSAAGRARPGRVVLSQPAQDLLAEDLAGQPRPRPAATGGPGTSGGPGAPDVLIAPYLPRAMLASMVAGHEEWLAELRQITVVFANLPDLDHRARLEEAQEAMVALQGALYRYEGSINKLSIDEKGTTLVAALGLPPLAHEDDPARGVQAALAMREAMAGLGRQVAIGVTTGRAFCGTVGSRWRREYTMLGAVVNLAARLMQQAGDGVLCDAATAEAARATLAFEALAPVRVKGRADPVPVYRPGRAARGPALGPVRGPVRRDPLVGREEERARLAAALSRLVTGGDGDGSQPDAVQVLVLEGEAGVGKSRLVAELVDQAAAAGLPVLAGAGDAVERNTPWHAWRELFGRLPPFDVRDQAARRRAVLDLFRDDPELLDLAPLLNPVLGLELPESASSAELSGQGRAGRTRDLLIRLLRAVLGDAPAVLVVEDAHWLDSASTGLVLTLSRERLPLLLVVATRSLGEAGTLADDLAWSAYRRLLRAPRMERLVLDRLSHEAVEALVGQRLDTASVPEVLARLVEEKAEGNPLFTEELTFALRDAGLVRVVDGRVELVSDVADVLARRLPHTVHGVITSRIDRLSPTQQLTVKVASVIGRVFAVGILRDIHPLRQAIATTLSDDLAEIERANLTVLDTPEPDLSYLFKHVIIQEAAYNLMLLSQRRRLHRSVAEWYERSDGGDLALLAHHWRLADVPDKAIGYLEQAGALALREGAYAEAVRFFTTLLEVEAGAKPDPGRRPGAPDAATIRRARWEHQLGDAYLGLGQLAPEQEHLHAALALLGRRTPASGRRLPGKLAWQTGQQLRNRAWPRPLVARSDAARAALEEAAEVYERLFLVDYHGSRRVRAVHQAVKGLNLAEAAGSRPAQARLAAACSVGAGLLARHRLAEAYLRRAFDALEGTGDASARAWVLQAAALYGVGVGRWPEVRRQLDEAAGIVRRLGDPRRLAEITGLQIWERYFQGELAGMPPMLAELDRLGRQSGDAQVRSWAMAGHAVAGLRAGNLEEAAAALARRPTPAPEALLALRLGDRARAVEALRRALEQASRPPVKCYWFDLYAMTTEAALALWLDERARGGGPAGPWRAMATQAAGYLGRFARVFPIGEPRARLYRGLLAWTSGRPGPARRDWRAALAAAEALGMRYDQALVLETLGRHGEPGQHPAARERARALFERLGVQDLTSPEALAARLATGKPPPDPPGTS